MSKNLIQKYTSSTDDVLRKIKLRTKPLTVNLQAIMKVVDQAKAYLEDSKYYMHQRKFSVSLTSVAYCEGLLDALRLLGAAEFEWSTKNKEKKGR
jgi:hypothetical protein